jgi:DNA mismatch endonuclease (patch repair protein)
LAKRGGRSRSTFGKKGEHVAEAIAVDPKRSAMMARIGQRNTLPEMSVRRWLHRAGYRFRLHRRELPGRPDITLPRHNLVVFVHGCFWHRHPGCSLSYMPKSRIEFWSSKFDTNVARDERVQRQLEEQGWTVAVVWECETRKVEALDRRLRELLPKVRRAR